MKSVLITGSNRGIGFETVLSFARAGYKVFATMRNLEAGNSLQQRLTGESLPVSIHQMDVDADESVKQCIETILKEHGKIDVLVNNAGIERHGSVEELTMADFKSMMETNYFGVLRCIQAVLPQMRANRSGCIINISSVAGKMAITPLGGYCASKFALEAISESLAEELKAFNIRVAIVEPGIISTDMARDVTIHKASIYPQSKRLAGMFAAALETERLPSIVADKILEIAEGGTWQLRHPAGADAEPFLQWRASMTDEQFVDWNAAADEEWYNSVESSFGLNARVDKELSNP